MAKLTTDDIKHLALLANLPIETEEVKRYQEQLSEVLDHVDQLAEVDTEGTEPVSQTTHQSNVSRVDRIDTTRLLLQDEALSGSEKIYNGLFVVSRIIEK